MSFTLYIIGVFTALLFWMFVVYAQKKISPDNPMSNATLGGALIISTLSWVSVVIGICAVLYGTAKALLDGVSYNNNIKNAFTKLPKYGESLFGPKHNAIMLEQMPSSNDKNAQLFIDLYNELYRIGTRCGTCDFTSGYTNYDNPSIHLKCTYFDNELDRTIRIDSPIRLVMQDSVDRTITLADIATYSNVHIESIWFSFDASKTYVEQEVVLKLLRELHNMGWDKNTRCERVDRSQFVLANKNDHTFAKTIKTTTNYLKRIK